MFFFSSSFVFLLLLPFSLPSFHDFHLLKPYLLLATLNKPIFILHSISSFVFFYTLLFLLLSSLPSSFSSCLLYPLLPPIFFTTSAASHVLSSPLYLPYLPLFFPQASAISYVLSNPVCSVPAVSLECDALRYRVGKALTEPRL